MYFSWRIEREQGQMSIKVIRRCILVMAGLVTGIELFDFLFYFIRQEYSAYACWMDLFFYEGSITYRLFFFFPVIGMVYYLIFQRTSGVNWRIRYEEPGSLVREQMKLSLWATGIMIAVECISMVLLCYCSGLPVMNWSNAGSMFCLLRGMTLDCPAVMVVMEFVLLRFMNGALLWMSQRICWKYGGRLWLWYLVVLIVGEVEYKFPVFLNFRITDLDTDLLRQPHLWWWRILAFIGMGIIYVWLEKRNIRK